MENFIETEKLRFKDIVYNDIIIPKGTVTFITGASGTGKSTLLKILNQTVSQDEGKVFLNGTDINTIDPLKLRQQLLLVSQGVFLFDESIKENFIKFYEYRNITPPDDEKIRYFLSLCSIDFSLDNSCSTISGGERQRVYTAIYLSFEPQSIMLDEPTSALDSENSIEVIKNITEFCKSKDIQIIIVSHDASLCKMFSENTIALEKEAE